MLTFDEQLHVYTWDGQVVPGVTSVLARLTSFEWVSPADLERARNLGRAVHSACEFDDLGTLDEATVAPVVAPYLEGYRKFMRELRPAWDGVEERVYHAIHGYAGTLDRRGFLYKKPAVLDIKTGAPNRVVRLQTAAYVEALCSTRTESVSAWSRWALYLRPDATYLLREVKAGRNDFRVFLSALNLYQWEKTND